MNNIDNIFKQFPPELTGHILSFLTPSELAIAEESCKLFKNCAQHPLTLSSSISNLIGGKVAPLTKEEMISKFKNISKMVEEHFPESFSDKGITLDTKFALALSRPLESLISKKKDFFPMSKIYQLFDDETASLAQEEIFNLALFQLENGKAKIDDESCILPLAIKAKLPTQIIEALIEKYHAPMEVAFPPIYGPDDATAKMEIIEWSIMQGASAEVIDLLFKHGGKFGEVGFQILEELEIPEGILEVLAKHGQNKNDFDY